MRNISFNNGFKLLRNYFEITENLPGYITIDLSKHGRLNNKDLKHIFNAFAGVLLIGKRLNILTLHVDGRGFTSYLCVDKDYVIENGLQK